MAHEIQLRRHIRERLVFSRLDVSTPFLHRLVPCDFPLLMAYHYHAIRLQLADLRVTRADAFVHNLLHPYEVLLARLSPVFARGCWDTNGDTIHKAYTDTCSRCSRFPQVANYCRHGQDRTALS